jgi:hypothetical protein
MKPPEKSDLDFARQSIMNARRLAEIASGRVSGKMNPKGLEWHEAAELAGAAKDLAYHANWMLKHLEAMQREVEPCS